MYNPILSKHRFISCNIPADSSSLFYGSIYWKL